MVPNIKYVFDDDKNYKTEQKVDLRACVGQCKQGIDYCCQPTMRQETIVLRKIGDATAPPIELEVSRMKKVSYILYIHLLIFIFKITVNDGDVCYFTTLEGLKFLHRLAFFFTYMCFSTCVVK